MSVLYLLFPNPNLQTEYNIYPSGHHGFSDNETANTIVGTICHSLLLVPFHSWRITHGKHHSNAGSCDHDEAFAPYTRSDMADHALRESPLAAPLVIFIMLTVGWPCYLVRAGWTGWTELACVLTLLT